MLIFQGFLDAEICPRRDLGPRVVVGSGFGIYVSMQYLILYKSNETCVTLVICGFNGFNVDKHDLLYLS